MNNVSSVSNSVPAYDIGIDAAAEIAKLRQQQLKANGQGAVQLIQQAATVGSTAASIDGKGTQINTYA